MKSVKCHYVPQFLLRRFIGANGQLACLRCNEHFLSTPKNIFAERDLYMTVEINEAFEKTGVVSLDFEKQLADFEGKISKIVEKICGTDEAGTLPDFNDYERRLILYFCISLRLRSPDVNQYYRDSAMGQPIKEMMAELVDKGVDANIAEQCVKNAGIVRMQKFINDPQKHIDELIDKHKHDPRKELVLRMHKNPFISIGYVEAAGSQFIIGSNLPAITDDGIWHPIASQIAIAPNCLGKDESVKLSVEKVEDINKRIYMGSHWIAARSPEAIEMLQKKHGKQKEI